MRKFIVYSILLVSIFFIFACEHIKVKDEKLDQQEIVNPHQQQNLSQQRLNTTPQQQPKLDTEVVDEPIKVLPKLKTYCGDNVCLQDEDCYSCSQDCGLCYKKRLKYTTQVEKEIVVFDIEYPPNSANFAVAMRYIDNFNILYTKLVYNILGYTKNDILQYTKKDRIVVHIGQPSKGTIYTDYRDVYNIECSDSIGGCGNIIHELIHIFNGPNFLGIQWVDDESFTIPLSIYINCDFGAICGANYAFLQNEWENLKFDDYLKKENVNYFFNDKNECGYSYTYLMLTQKFNKREDFFTNLYSLLRMSNEDTRNLDKRAQFVYQATNNNKEVYEFLKSHGCKIS